MITSAISFGWKYAEKVDSNYYCLLNWKNTFSHLCWKSVTNINISILNKNIIPYVWANNVILHQMSKVFLALTESVVAYWHAVLLKKDRGQKAALNRQRVTITLSSKTKGATLAAILASYLQRHKYERRNGIHCLDRSFLQTQHFSSPAAQLQLLLAVRTAGLTYSEVLSLRRAISSWSTTKPHFSQSKKAALWRALTAPGIKISRPDAFPINCFHFSLQDI